jgi:hypothetical protein
MRKINLSYADFKAMTARKKLQWQYTETDCRYNIFAIDKAIEYQTEVFKDGYEPDGMDAQDNTANRGDFETNFEINANSRLEEAKTKDSFLRVTQEPRSGSAINFYSPNFCNQTTWYKGSTLVSDFVLTDSGDQTTYNTNGTHPGPWVDMYHGKLFNEDALVAAHPEYGLKVEVQTGGTGSFVEKAQNSFDKIDGDYSVNYDSGTVTFNSAIGGSDVVRATFAVAPATMTWTMQPSAGKRLKLMYAEFQMTSDVEMTDDIWYQTWAFNPYDFPNKVKVFEYRYKTISDLLYESTGVFPLVAGFGGNGPRGLGDHDIIIFPFRYNTARDIYASQGVEIRIVTNSVHIGTMATTTLYCLEEAEE